MTIEERIVRVEKAIADLIEHRDWLRSHEWGESRKRSVELGENLDQTIDHYDRAIEMNTTILAALRAR